MTSLRMEEWSGGVVEILDKQMCANSLKSLEECY